MKPKYHEEPRSIFPWPPFTALVCALPLAVAVVIIIAPKVDKPFRIARVKLSEVFVWLDGLSPWVQLLSFLAVMAVFGFWWLVKRVRG